MIKYKTYLAKYDSSSFSVIISPLIFVLCQFVGPACRGEMEGEEPKSSLSVRVRALFDDDSSGVVNDLDK